MAVRQEDFTVIVKTATRVRRAAEPRLMTQHQEQETPPSHATRMGVVVTRPGGYIELMEPRAAELLGLILPLKEDATLEDVLTAPSLAGAQVTVSGSTASFKSASGLDLEIHATSCPKGGLILVVTDTTAERGREGELKRAESEYRSLFEHAVCGIYRDTIDGKPVRANRALVNFNGYETEAEYFNSVTRSGGNWYVDPERPKLFHHLMETQGEVRDLVSEVYSHRTRKRYWITENAWYVRDASGTPIYIEGTIQDATERVEGMAAIERQANTDPLTGAASRFFFMNKLNQLTRDTRSQFVLFAVDLDKFKDVNDQLGHAAGDAVLKAVVTRLRQIAGPQATVARLGGDEFAVIGPGTSASMNADMTAAEIIRTLRQPIQLAGQSVVVGVSVGIALYPAHASNAKELLSHADLALYQVKSSGRNGACFFDPELKVRQMRRQALEQELREAVPADQLELYYQPIISTATGKVTSYEALMRWNHPRRGLLAPGEFIPLAEDAGLMGELGNWAITRACQQAALLPPHISVAVNVSPNQFRSAGTVEAVKQALRSTQLAAHRLTLEVTETVILSGESVAAKVIEELLGLGVNLALDDFGTGYSSLSYLQRFAFSKVKVDRSFVAGIEQKPKNLSIIRAIIKLARDLGMDVVAEGIETQGQSDVLKAEGCGFLQGYLYGKPKPFLEIAADLALLDLGNCRDKPLPAAAAGALLRRTVHNTL